MPTMPAVISILKDRAQEVRESAMELNLTFKEEEVWDGIDVVRFTFEISDDDLFALLAKIPQEAFARRGIISPLQSKKP